MFHISHPLPAPRRLTGVLLLGGLGGVAAGVLMSVAAGSAPIGPIAFPALTGVVGAAALLIVDQLTNPPRWMKVVAAALWSAAVAMAAVFVIAAIALRNFE